MEVIYKINIIVFDNFLILEHYWLFKFFTKIRIFPHKTEPFSCKMFNLVQAIQFFIKTTLTNFSASP